MERKRERERDTERERYSYLFFYVCVCVCVRVCEEQILVLVSIMQYYSNEVAMGWQGCPSTLRVKLCGS